MNPLPSRGFTWNIKSKIGLDFSYESLAEDSLETSSYFLRKTMKKYLWKSSAAVVIGALRVKITTGTPVNDNYACLSYIST